MSPRIILDREPRLLGYSLRELWPLIVAAVLAAVIVGVMEM